MRISEKTLELSILAQFTQRLGIPNALWIGLTQGEEKQLGFDAASVVDGSLFILQFKASNIITGPGSFVPWHRKFKLPHAQLTRLQFVATAFPGSVFYALPNVGNTDELQLNRDLVAQTWLLAVDQLQNPYPAPRGVSHYAYLAPPHCELHSTPEEVKLLPLQDLVRQISASQSDRAASPGVRGNAARVAALLREPNFALKGRRVYGLLIPP